MNMYNPTSMKYVQSTAVLGIMHVLLLLPVAVVLWCQCHLWNIFMNSLPLPLTPHPPPTHSDNDAWNANIRGQTEFFGRTHTQSMYVWKNCQYAQPHWKKWKLYCGSHESRNVVSCYTIKIPSPLLIQLSTMLVRICGSFELGRCSLKIEALAVYICTYHWMSIQSLEASHLQKKKTV